VILKPGSDDKLNPVSCEDPKTTTDADRLLTLSTCPFLRVPDD